MKDQKRLLAFILAFALILALTSCVFADGKQTGTAPAVKEKGIFVDEDELIRQIQNILDGKDPNYQLGKHDYYIDNEYGDLMWPTDYGSYWHGNFYMHMPISIGVNNDGMIVFLDFRTV